MSAVNVTNPALVFLDIDGQPLEDGYVWIGVSGLEPQANPQTAYWDAALTLTVTQPVRTRGGYPLNGAAIGRLYTADAYSVKVQNKNTSTITLDLTGAFFGQNFNAPVIISANATALTLPTATTALLIGGADGANTGTATMAFGGVPVNIFQRANGTNAVPTAVGAFESLGITQARGYNGSAYSLGRATIGFVTAEAWTPAANGAYINFGVTPAGGTGTTEVVVINDIGCVDIGRAGISGPALTPTAPARLWIRSGNPYTDKATAASGTVAHGAFSSFGADGINATNASVTYTNASTVYVAGAPSAGTNVTITNPWATYIAAGKSYLGDRVDGNPVNVDSVGFRGVPVNSQSAAYQLVAADAGKSIVHPITDNNARTFTIPANGTVPFPIGTTITFINLINTVTIAITTDTMYLAGAGTTGSRTLAAYGMATAVKVGATSWIISGNGLT